MVNASTFNTYYDDVRVGDDAIVYGVNRGLGPHRQPAQLRAGVARAARDAVAAPTRQTVRWAQEHEAAPTAGG